ncbi:MAG: biotin--[acetyl-CoA-carboxylase] ligase [Methanohalobium sp.]|uniref:biotin--[acetyl-CoA-carboxylase] ligase n=1 Tax=Methanohalobium sp. TaxID=2837493 RepID=UPI00397BC6EB
MSDRKEDILKILKDSNKKPVSGEELGEQLGISRTMVWKYIKSLKYDGYDITSSTKTGYVLNSSPDLLYPEEIQNGLRTKVIGKKIYHFDEVESTNNEAKKIAHDEDEGTVIISETQKSGKGRMGREWVSPRGGIYMSVILKPTAPASHAYHLTLVTGIAVANAIRNLGIGARIKWSNDVLINNNKVCGILTEINAEMEEVDYTIIGIGINANIDTGMFSNELKEGSTSIKSELGKPLERVSFVRNLFYELEQEYIKFKSKPFTEIINEWINLSDTIGKHVSIMTHSKMIEGKAIGITKNGALIVKKPDGQNEEVIAGRCIYTKTK